MNTGCRNQQELKERIKPFNILHTPSCCKRYGMLDTV